MEQQKINKENGIKDNIISGAIFVWTLIGITCIRARALLYYRLNSGKKYNKKERINFIINYKQINKAKDQS